MLVTANAFILSHALFNEASLTRSYLPDHLIDYLFFVCVNVSSHLFNNRGPTIRLFEYLSSARYKCPVTS